MPHKDPEKRKEYAKQYNKEWYKNNCEAQKQKVRNRKNIILDWFRNYKKTLRCSQCDEDHISCLEFHHIDPKLKERSICVMIRDSSSINRIQKEIDKCKVLCCNCHKKLHWEEK